MPSNGLVYCHSLIGKNFLWSGHVGHACIILYVLFSFEYLLAFHNVDHIVLLRVLVSKVCINSFTPCTSHSGNFEPYLVAKI